MKSTLLGLIGVLLTAQTMNIVHAEPYGPQGTSATAIGANGQVIDIRVYGDEFCSHAEDAAGYTVVYDKAMNAHCYATLNAAGDDLVSTGKIIGTLSPGKLGLAKSLRITADAQHAKAKKTYESTAARMICEKVRLEEKIKDLKLKGAPAEVITELSSLYHSRFSGLTGLPTPPSTNAAHNSPPTSTTSGSISGILILVNFPDDSSEPFTLQQFLNYCNQTGYNEFGNTGSVKDYFYDQSLGNLTYTNTVVGYVRMPNSRSYYDDDMVNSIGDPAGSHKLVREAVTEAMKELDLTQLSAHANGVIRGVNIMYVGKRVYGKALWPHRHVLIKNEGGTEVLDPISVGGDKYVLDYQMTDIGDTGELAIGTFCHESGHLICGFGDYYDYGYDSSGVGTHCLMGGGNSNNGGRTPAGLNAYLRYKAGWITPTTLSDSGTGSLNASQDQAYIFRKNSTEYFMVENRQNSRKWDAYLKDQGLVIWHVDETQPNNNDQNHYELDLEQADGYRDLNLYQNAGDSTDYFDNTTSNFSNVTSPNSNWYGATASNLNISSISAIGTTMTFSYDTTGGGGSGQPDLKAFGGATVSAYSVVQGTSFSTGLNIQSADASSSSHTTTFYFSTDTIIDSSDIVLDSFASSGISTGNYEYQNITAVLPAGVTPGTYYVGCLIDSTNSVSESNESNNTIYFTNPITVTAIAAANPNLKDDGSDWHTLSSTAVTQTSSFSMGIDVRCDDAAAGAHTTYFYFSTDNTITSGDYLIGGYSSNGITAGNWETQSISVQNFPQSVPAGTYYVGCIIDANGSITESNEADNAIVFNISKQVTVSVPTTGGTTDLKDDGIAYHVVSSTSVNHGGSITLGLDVAIANADASAHTTRFYFSTDTILDLGDYHVGSYSSNGITLYTSTYGYEDQDIAISNFSSSIPTGTYYIICSIDSYGVVAESDETNNVVVLGTQVTVSPASSGGGGGGGGCSMGAATSSSLIPLLMVIITAGLSRFRHRKS